MEPFLGEPSPSFLGTSGLFLYPEGLPGGARVPCHGLQGLLVLTHHALGMTLPREWPTTPRGSEWGVVLMHLLGYEHLTYFGASF